MPKFLLPDHPEALDKLWEESGRLLEAWEPLLARSRRIESELREGFKNLIQKDLAGVLGFLHHYRNVEELARRVRVDVAALSTHPYLVLQYVDFTDVVRGQPALSQQWREFVAGAQPGHHDLDSALNFMKKFFR